MVEHQPSKLNTWVRFPSPAFVIVYGIWWINLRPEAGLLKIRKELGLFANLRPATLYPKLVSAGTMGAIFGVIAEEDEEEDF